MNNEPATTDAIQQNYDGYESQFDELEHDRAARRKRKPRVQSVRTDTKEIVATIADTEALEIGFETTYQPSRFEAGWLLDSIKPFIEQGLIVDVLAQIKGGKEASVYRCQAHPDSGLEYLAAKVYRPRAVRNLRNDALYREGREVLTDGGRVVRKSDARVMRAIGKKSAFGIQVRHASWLLYEYITLRDLYAAGAAVPQPYAASDNAILMSYVGDGTRPAPTLHEVDLTAAEARALFAEALRNLELMTSLGKVHGDLSAYNILYAQGQITLIDFPQVIDLNVNRQARHIFGRDVQRICDYFQGQGVACDPEAITTRLWSRYGLDRTAEMDIMLYELHQAELDAAAEDDDEEE